MNRTIFLALLAIIAVIFLFDDTLAKSLKTTTKKTTTTKKIKLEEKNTTKTVSICPMFQCAAPLCKDWEYGKFILDDGFLFVQLTLFLN